MNYGYDNQYPSGSYGQGGGEGGYMNEAGSSQGGKKYAKESLRAVTIKQINEATQAYPEADFKIDDTEITQISFVGQVRNISQLTTFVTYKIDDGTGDIEVKRWLDNADRNDGMEDPMDTSESATRRSSKKEIVVNGYAKVWGKLGVYNNRRSVTAHVIRPLTNMDEYHCHFLEATAMHLYFTRGPPPSKDGAAATKDQGEIGAGNTAGNMAITGKPLPHMSPIARKLYDTLSNTMQSREGLHAQHLAGLMHMPLSDVYKASEELQSHSLIFPTVDDNTWAILEI
ncbi:Replication factor A protein 2 [Ophidiomyces ophidiicola]|nr:Replication factor A protein 2 [Ophidiomyces ophidiicola]